MPTKHNGRSAMALSAVIRDPDVGKVSVGKGWTADVSIESGVRRARVRRGAVELTLTRLPATDRPSEGWPDQVPFVPGFTSWWGYDEQWLMAAWVGHGDKDEVLASVVTSCSNDGWSLESTLIMARPFPRVTVLTKGISRRVVLEQGGAVMLMESPVTTAPSGE